MTSTSHSKPTHSKQTDTKQSDSKQNDSKRSDSKQSDSKHSDSKHSDSKQADSKQSDSKQSDSKESDSKQSDSKQSDSKQSDSKQSDSKQSDSKQSDSKQSDSKQSDARQPSSKTSGSTQSKRIAILATHGFEQSELMEPLEQLKAAGFTVQVVSPEGPQIRGWKGKDWGDSVDVDVKLSEASPQDYDALVLPGGVINPDSLRTNAEAVAFIKAFDDAGKPLAAVCHAPWLLAEAGAAKGRKLTSWPSVRTDLRNAGAHWKDAEVVVDAHIITSRKPDDLPAFCRAVIDAVNHVQARAA